ncbi:hypothetical protein [Ulvibacterium sp.]|uniref:hypothetical protein n=1 Tax=Ulvibacterium sp. TaxID=2665914 RepID=UPI00263907CC|nr:hypothetical protein [Ulvibacterium sp.]
MKRVIFLFFLVGFINCSTDSENEFGENQPMETEEENSFEGEIDWIRNFGGSGEDTPRTLVATLDGGYAILGYTNSIDGDLTNRTLEVNDYWLLKLDVDGNLQWSKTYGGSMDDRGQSVVQTMDGGYAITGYAMSSDGDGTKNEGFHDNWIVKLDATGNIEWERSYGFSGHDHSYDLVQTSDGGYFFIGFLDITAARADGYEEKSRFLTRHGVGEFWGTKIDAQGNIEWRRYFGGSNNDRAHAVVQADDGGFVMAGFSESDDFDISNTKGSYDFWVLKIDSQGDLVWERSFGGTGIEVSQDIVKTNDGNYVVTGHTFSTDTDISKNNGEADIWLIKIDDSGNLLWEKTFGGSQFDAAENVSLAQDGGFIISGNSKSLDTDVNSNNGENDIWVIKTDAKGILTWQENYGGAGLDFGFDALQNQDGSILLVGEMEELDFQGLQSKGKTDLVLIKIK